jgi:hypothetical protein
MIAFTGKLKLKKEVWSGYKNAVMDQRKLLDNLILSGLTSTQIINDARYIAAKVRVHSARNKVKNWFVDNEVIEGIYFIEGDTYYFDDDSQTFEMLFHHFCEVELC